MEDGSTKSLMTIGDRQGNKSYLKVTDLRIASCPTSTTGLTPTGVWSDEGSLRIGEKTSFFMKVSGSVTTTFGRAFTTHIFPNIDEDELDANGNSYYNTSTGMMTLPYSGIYMVSGTMRSKDSNQTNAPPAGTQWGVGIHTGNHDGSHFLWHTVNNTNNQFDRTTYSYSKVIKYNLGDVLRTIIYLDDGTPRLMSGGEMCVYRMGD